MLTAEIAQPFVSAPSIPDVWNIPYVTADEAYRLLTGEFERFNRSLDTLEPGDWDRPTACTAWNIRQMVSHQAGGYACGTGYGRPHGRPRFLHICLRQLHL